VLKGLRTVIYAVDGLPKAKEWEHGPIQDVGEGILIGSVIDPFGNVLGIIQNPHFKIG
jgi:hypothetical protein